VARSDHDTWHAASSAGVTATMIAAIRAIASRDAHAIVKDPFAEPLVKAAGIEVFVRLIHGEIAPTEMGDDPHYSLSHLIDSMTVRTRFFDDFFVTAADAGIQAVILASGLDSPAYRLPWPDGAVVYEIDQAPAIEFKTRALSRVGASPRADHRPVAVDLRHDWAKALLDNGFEMTTPTAWSADGLLMYLPPALHAAYGLPQPDSDPCAPLSKIVAVTAIRQ
jgi:methyltransferase (TIGR00027 family)